MADNVLDRKTCSEGEWIFREDQEGNSAYIIQNGSVNIIKKIDGKDVILANIGKGAIFGEMALIDDKPRMASARADEGGATCIVISRNLFEDKLAKADPFVRGLLKIFAEQIRSMSDQKSTQSAPYDSNVAEAHAAAAAVASDIAE